MRKKIWFWGSLFVTVAACFLIALPSAQAYSYSNSYTVDYGATGYYESTDNDPRYAYTFDFNGFSDVESFTLELHVSGTGITESWHVRVGIYPDDTQRYMGFWNGGSGDKWVSFDFDNEDVTFVFDATTGKGQLQLWFAAEGWHPADFTLYSATLTVNGTEAAVPIPGAAWLLGSGLIGLVGIRKRFRKS